MSGKHADPKAKKKVTSLDVEGFAPIAANGERRAAIAQERQSDTQAPTTEKVKTKRNKRVAVSKNNKPKRKKVDLIITIVAEILIVLGLVSGLFLLWKFVIVDYFTNSAQSSSASEVVKEFNSGADLGSLEYDKYDPPVTARPGHAETIGVLYIPRLDPTYKRVIAEGTTRWDVLDNPETGIGHYAESQMPGELGNFALAGHRNSVFTNLKSIVPGDHIYVQTAEGYYTYVMEEEHSIVTPSDVQVIAPVPNEPGVEPTESFITLTTCWPEWSNTERLIVHAKFVEWRPLAAGPPAEIAAAVNG